MILGGNRNDGLASANDLIPVRPHVASEWRDAVLNLAGEYYRQGHADEDAGIWDRAEAYRIAYADLCALVGRLDPRPGGGSSPAKPW